jgi:hypothetical protein
MQPDGSYIRRPRPKNCKPVDAQHALLEKIPAE